MKKHYTSSGMFYLAIYRANTAQQMRKVIDSCENIDVTNDLGTTALMLAVYAENKKVARLLIESGANPEAKDIYGWSVLDRAPQGKIKAMILRAIETKKRLARINKSRGLSR